MAFKCINIERNPRIVNGRTFTRLFNGKLTVKTGLKQSCIIRNGFRSGMLNNGIGGTSTYWRSSRGSIWYGIPRSCISIQNVYHIYIILYMDIVYVYHIYIILYMDIVYVYHIYTSAYHSPLNDHLSLLGVNSSVNSDIWGVGVGGAIYGNVYLSLEGHLSHLFFWMRKEISLLDANGWISTWS